MKRISTPAMVIYVILALVVGSYLYYSQYYIPNKESILINKGVRTLASIDEGISNKEDFLKSFMDQRLNANTLLWFMDEDAKDIRQEIDSLKATEQAERARLIDLAETKLSTLEAQKVIVTNHVKPMPIRAGNWTDSDPPIIFDSGLHAEEPFLRINHLSSEARNSMIKAFRLQEQLAKEEAKKIEAEANKQIELENLLKEAQKTFFIMGGEGKGYISDFSAANKAKARAKEVWRSTPSRAEAREEDRLVAEITLDTLLKDVMENEIFQCVVL